MDQATRMKKEAREDFEARILELRKSLERLDKEKIGRALLHEKFRLREA